MKHIKHHLRRLLKIKKESYHPLQHKIHKKYHISRKTLFYMKEYGSRAHVIKTIVKESIKVLILASIISSFGGFALEKIKIIFLSIAPLIILLPALNALAGNYGSIISSRFSTMLFEGKIKHQWWNNSDLKKLFIQIMIIGVITASLSSLFALGVSRFIESEQSFEIAIKVFLIAIINVTMLITLMFFISIVAGIYFYQKKEDPNNFLIPIATSIADFGNIVLLSILIVLFF